MVLEARIKCQQVPPASEASGKECFFACASFWLLPSILGIPWLVEASLPSASIITWPSPCVSVPFPSAYKDTVLLDLGPTLILSDLIITCLYLQRPCVQNKVAFTGSRWT